jgi:hypothetical protein
MSTHGVLDFFKDRLMPQDKEIEPKGKRVHDAEPDTDPETDSCSEGKSSDISDDYMSSDEDEVANGAVLQEQSIPQDSDDC